MKLKKILLGTGIVSIGVLASCGGNEKELIAKEFQIEEPNVNNLEELSTGLNEFTEDYDKKHLEKLDGFFNEYKSITIQNKYVSKDSEGNEKSGYYYTSTTDFETGNTYFYHTDFETVEGKRVNTVMIETYAIRGEKSYTVATEITFNEYLVPNSKEEKKVSGQAKMVTSVPVDNVILNQKEKYTTEEDIPTRVNKFLDKSLLYNVINFIKPKYCDLSIPGCLKFYTSEDKKIFTSYVSMNNSNKYYYVDNDYLYKGKYCSTGKTDYANDVIYNKESLVNKKIDVSTYTEYDYDTFYDEYPSALSWLSPKPLFPFARVIAEESYPIAIQYSALEAYIK
ncbi:hypothetical protein EI71_00766 [Anaeroplasma bactoclasticum]|uniref:Lipoprotein n=1 Tax=Anaeroplasma bactoclasticum TaxID=2088 RepID=A0A397S6B9_9MOLU|nr:hypothetical protein [Anaeroplasma bactoclasticum]RIA77794.1 hypothetical protein EI71_00766 [Anaeroplasma bactoclasticum]